MPSETADDNTPGKDNGPQQSNELGGENTKDASEGRPQSQTTANGSGSNKDAGERKPARGPEPFEKWEREEMENLLGELCGHLGMARVNWLLLLADSDN